MSISPIKSLVELLREDGPSTLQEHHREAIMDTFNNNTRLARAFVPEQFHGDMSLFVATESKGEPPIDAWRTYVGGKIKMHRIDCTHENMMDPGPAEKIGRVLTAELSKQKAIALLPSQRRKK